MAASRAKSSRSSAPADTPRRAITVEDLLRLDVVSGPQISPDGRRLLFMRKQVGEKNAYTTNLWTVDVEGGTEPQPFTSGDKDSRGRWSPDGRLVAFVSGRKKPRTQIYLIPAAGGEARVLTDFPEGSLGDFKWSPDGRQLAVAFRETDPTWTEAAKKEREELGLSTPPRVLEDGYYRLDGDGYFDQQRYHLYLVDVETGAHRQVFDQDRLGNFTFDWAPDSRQLVLSINTSRRAMVKPWKDELVLLEAATGRVTKIPDLPPGTKTTVAWSPDGQHVAYVGREGKQSIWGVANTHLFICDPRKGDPVNLTEREDYCVEAATLSDVQEAAFDAQLCWSPDSRRIYLRLSWQGTSQIASIAVKGGPFVFHTAGERVLGLGNISTDGMRLALTEATPLSPPEAAVGEIGSGLQAARAAEMPVRRLSDFNRWLREEIDLITPEMHWVESTGGTKVQTWLLKPASLKEGKKAPAILEIHGGPHTQYGWIFFHEFQLLAAQGYVVCYSNPRGSKGYGEAHTMAIKGKWGHADWEDIQAVTAFLKQQPFVSNRKLGVMGGSYGGYMTNWTIGHCDDFAAAITDRCVSNLVSMAGSSDLPLVPGHYWEGNAWDQPDQLWQQSPMKYLGNVKTPTLIIHSEGDLRCNVEQSEQVFAALMFREIPTRFIRYPASTSHGMSRSGPPDLRMHRLREILRWWAQYLS